MVVDFDLWESEYPFTALTGAFGDGESGRNTPPHRDSLELAQLLLDAGADPNDSQTLYNRHWRADDTHLQLLLDYGLGRGTATVWQARIGLAHPTPQELVEEELRGAARPGRLERVRMLIDRGRRTPLHEAAFHGHLELVRALNRPRCRSHHR